MLTRFVTDLETMEQYKLNSRFDFPSGDEILDLKPFSDESLGMLPQL